MFLFLADLDEEMEEIQVGIDFMGSQMETMLGPEEKAEFDIILAKKQAEKQKIVEVMLQMKLIENVNSPHPKYII